MPSFAYKATDRAGKTVSGVLDGKDEAAVIERLQAQELFPLSVAAGNGEAVRTRAEFSLKRLLARVRRRDVLVVTQQLATLVDAGLDLDRSLAVLTELHQGEKVQEVLERVRRNVQGGASLADALAKHPRVFSRLYVNMIRSGESGGVLDAILTRLAGFLENSQELRDEIISALIYPLLLVVVGGASVSILLTFVIPKFAQIFAELGAELPLPTRIVIGIATAIKSYWYFVLAGAGLAVYAFRSWVRTDEGRLRWDAFKLRLPIIGPLVRKIEVARFARTLGTLSRSGVPLLSGLAIVKDTLTNEVMSRALIDVYSGLKEGSSMWEPLRETGQFPPLAIHMIRVGEETGGLEPMLIKVADTFEAEVRTATKRAMGLLEPLMILLMGLLVGAIVISMLLAIFSVSDLAF